jgi:hypothetical protein
MEIGISVVWVSDGSETEIKLTFVPKWIGKHYFLILPTYMVF